MLCTTEVYRLAKTIKWMIFLDDDVRRDDDFDFVDHADLLALAKRKVK